MTPNSTLTAELLCRGRFVTTDSCWLLWCCGAMAYEQRSVDWSWLRCNIVRVCANQYSYISCYGTCCCLTEKRGHKMTKENGRTFVHCCTAELAAHDFVRSSELRVHLILWLVRPPPPLLRPAMGWRPLIIQGLGQYCTKSRRVHLTSIARAMQPGYSPNNALTIDTASIIDKLSGTAEPFQYLQFCC